MTRQLAFLVLFCMAEPATAQDMVAAKGMAYRESIDLQGATVHGYQVTPISAKLGGFVKSLGKDGKLDVDVGSRVKAGQVLAELDIPEMQDDLRQRHAAVEQAKSVITQARAAVIEAQAMVAQKQAALLQVEAGTAQKKAKLQLAETRLRRISSLASRGSISSDNLDEARYEVESARAGLQTIEADVAAAKANIEAAKATVQKAQADIGNAEAMQKVAAAAVSHTETMMGYTTIKAPYDGLITGRMVDMSTFVQPAENNSGAMPMFEVTQIDRVRVIVSVPNNRVDGIEAGQKVIFHSIGGMEGRRFEGTITRLAGALDLKTRTLRIEAHFGNPAKDVVSGKPYELKPGLFGTMTVIRKEWTTETPLPVVPTTSVGRDNDGNNYVVVMSNGEPTRRQVSIAFNDAALIGIRNGLTVGEEVVRSGVSKY